MRVSRDPKEAGERGNFKVYQGEEELDYLVADDGLQIAVTTEDGWRKFRYKNIGIWDDD